MVPVPVKLLKSSSNFRWQIAIGCFPSGGEDIACYLAIIVAPQSSPTPADIFLSAPRPA
jgi:hypothetical protein